MHIFGRNNHLSAHKLEIARTVAEKTVDYGMLDECLFVCVCFKCFNTHTHVLESISWFVNHIHAIQLGNKHRPNTSCIQLDMTFNDNEYQHVHANNCNLGFQNVDDLICYGIDYILTLRWRHNDHDGVSNHQPRGCLLNRLFSRRSKKTSKLSVTGLCAGNYRWIPAQRASNAENASIWWRHHDNRSLWLSVQ